MDEQTPRDHLKKGQPSTMKHKKQIKENLRWLVAVRAKSQRKKNEVFGFPTKRGAIAFIKDIAKMGRAWMFADAGRGENI